MAEAAGNNHRVVISVNHTTVNGEEGGSIIGNLPRGQLDGKAEMEQTRCASLIGGVAKPGVGFPGDNPLVQSTGVVVVACNTHVTPDDLVDPPGRKLPGSKFNAGTFQASFYLEQHFSGQDSQLFSATQQGINSPRPTLARCRDDRGSRALLNRQIQPRE